MGWLRKLIGLPEANEDSSTVKAINSQKLARPHQHKQTFRQHPLPCDCSDWLDKCTSKELHIEVERIRKLESKHRQNHKFLETVPTQTSQRQ